MFLCLVELAGKRGVREKDVREVASGREMEKVLGIRRPVVGGAR